MLDSWGIVDDLNEKENKGEIIVSQRKWNGVESQTQIVAGFRQGKGAEYNRGQQLKVCIDVPLPLQC